MDQPASSQAFWAIYDATGIRPEWLIPGLAIESGLNPSLPNAAGFPYYGINQISGTWISQNLGVTPQAYLTWSASQQLLKAVLPYMRGQVAAFGKLQSGIRVYQANFYPASLSYARTLDSTIVAKPSAAYNANAGLDANGSGAITPGDLGVVLQKQLSKSYVVDAISQAYAQRPWEQQTDPIYGLDFQKNLLADPLVATIAAAGIVLASGFAAHWLVQFAENKPLTLPAWARVL